MHGNGNRKEPVILDHIEDFFEEGADIALMFEHMRAPDDIEFPIKFAGHEITDIIGGFMKIDGEYLLAEQLEKPAVLTRAGADVQHRVELAMMARDQLQEPVEAPRYLEFESFPRWRCTWFTALASTPAPCCLAAGIIASLEATLGKAR